MPKCTITPRFVKHGTPTPVDAGIEAWLVSLDGSIQLVITKQGGGEIKINIGEENTKRLIGDIIRLTQ